MKEKFSTRLARALTLKNIKPVELAEKTGLPKSGISQYLKDICVPKEKNIVKIADVLNVNKDWLMGYDVPIDRDTININQDISFNTYPIPLYGQISAGVPNWAEEELEGYFPIAPELMSIINPQEYFFLRVNGESMNKIMRNGSLALIHKQDYVENGEIAVVLVNGDNATIKKFTKQDNIIVLEPESNDPEFKTQVYDKKTPIRILGKYVGKLEMNK